MYPNAQPQPPKKKAGPLPWILGGCGCLTLAGIVGMVGCTALIAGAPQTDTGTGADAEQAADGGGGAEGGGDEAATYAVGEEFEHGNFAFTVNGVERGLPSVTDEFGLSSEPRGTYVVVSMTAANVSSEAQYLEGSNQLLMDDDGKQYEYDLSASTDTSFLDQVNPGQSAEAEIVYDVPEDAAITHMMVNGKTLVDDGVRVDLPE
ncbi:DUF4352 domain-containing protein [Nocardiopsis coralliicola]